MVEAASHQSPGRIDGHESPFSEEDKSSQASLPPSLDPHGDSSLEEDGYSSEGSDDSYSPLPQ